MITSVGRRRTGSSPRARPRSPARYENTANAAAAAITTKPTAIGMVITTGRNAPTTHVSWNRVSNRANDRPRLASGASRWTTESKASFPLLAASPTHSAERGRGGDAPGPGGQEAGDRGGGQHDLQDALLGRPGAPQSRRHQRPEQRPDAARRQHEAELVGRRVARPQREGDQEREEPDDAAQHAHGRRRQHDAAAPQLLALGLGRAVDRHLGGRHLDAEHGGDGEHDHRQHQHPLAAGDQERQAARASRPRT